MTPLIIAKYRHLSPSHRHFILASYPRPKPVHLNKVQKAIQNLKRLEELQKETDLDRLKQLYSALPLRKIHLIASFHIKNPISDRFKQLLLFEKTFKRGDEEEIRRCIDGAIFLQRKIVALKQFFFSDTLDDDQLRKKIHDRMKIAIKRQTGTLSVVEKMVYILKHRLHCPRVDHNVFDLDCPSCRKEKELFLELLK